MYKCTHFSIDVLKANIRFYVMVISTISDFIKLILISTMTFSYGNDFVQRRLAYNFLNLLLVCFAQHLFANIGKYEDQLCARGLPKGA